MVGDSSYFIVAGISILILCVNLLHLNELDLINKKSITQFRILFFYIIAEIVIDTIFRACEGNSGVDPIVLYILKGIECVMNPVLPLAILKLFNDNHVKSLTIKCFQITIQIIIVVNALLQFASLFEHFMFTIDENNMIQNTNWSIIYNIALILCTCMMLIGMYIFSNRIQHANVLTLTGIFGLLLVGFILKMVSKDYNFDWLSVAISAVFIDIYYVDLGLRLDPLTQLLNRHVYETLLEKINYSTLIIMIDANNFKSINDTYGHDCGDRTLRSISKCIIKAFGEYAYCFRIGGDEFCVILKPRMFQKLISQTPQNDIYVMSESLMTKLDEIIEQHESSNNCLQFGVSQGYGIYYNHSEYPSIKNNMPLEKVIKLADMRMYRKKKQFRASLADKKDSSNTQTTSAEKGRIPVLYKDSDPELVE